MTELESLNDALNQKINFEDSEKLGNYILFLLERSSLSCLLNMQIERIIMHKLGKSEEKGQLIKRMRDMLIQLCLDEKIDALIPLNITKSWKLQFFPDIFVTVDENDQTFSKKINQGSYYTWDYEPFFEDYELMFKCGENSLDTYYIRQKYPEQFQNILKNLRLKLDSSPKLNYKLMWVIHEHRKKLPL